MLIDQKDVRPLLWHDQKTQKTIAIGSHVNCLFKGEWYIFQCCGVTLCSSPFCFFTQWGPLMSYHLPRSNDTTSLWDENRATTPAFYIKCGIGIKASRVCFFYLKGNLLNGSTAVSRQSTAVKQLLPSSPPMCNKMTKRQALSQAELFCCSAT